MEENKVRTKTEEFKTAVQEKVAEVLGVKVSKQKAWDLFKELSRVPFSQIIKNWRETGSPEINYGEKHKELELPLSGVATYKVITTGTSEKFSVRGRVYLSSALDRAIKDSLGFGGASLEDNAPTDTDSEVVEFDDLEI